VSACQQEEGNKYWKYSNGAKDGEPPSPLLSESTARQITIWTSKGCALKPHHITLAYENF